MLKKLLETSLILVTSTTMFASAILAGFLLLLWNEEVFFELEARRVLGFSLATILTSSAGLVGAIRASYHFVYLFSGLTVLPFGLTLYGLVITTGHYFQKSDCVFLVLLGVFFLQMLVGCLHARKLEKGYDLSSVEYEVCEENGSELQLFEPFELKGKRGTGKMDYLHREIR